MAQEQQQQEKANGSAKPVWSEASRRKLSLAMKRAHAAKKHWKGKANPGRVPRGNTRAAVEQRREFIRTMRGQGFSINDITQRTKLTASAVYMALADKKKAEPARNVGSLLAAESLIWLKHASREIHAAMRAGREPTTAELYTLMALRKAAK